MPSPQQLAELRERMARLDLSEEDLVEKFVRGSGSGGQKINKTSSCVFLQHPASGIEMKVQRDRSREVNRYLARIELCEQLEARSSATRMARKQAREKVRRQKRRPSKAARARNVERKRRHGQKKSQRRRPGLD